MRTASRQPVWQPLRAAIALLVSHDEAFAKSVGRQKPSKHSSFQVTLPGNLLDALEEDGALVLKDIGVRSTRWDQQPRHDYVPSETYHGRFGGLLQEFRQQDLSFGDYVVACIASAGRLVAHWISEGSLSARDSNGKIPSDLASQLEIDWERDFENGPPDLIMRDPEKRRRRHVEVHWPQLLACIRDQSLSEIDAEPADGKGATGFEHDAGLSGTVTVSDGPVVRPSPVDPLELDTWPLGCVIAWIDAGIRGLAPAARDDLVRQAYRHEARALPINVMAASRLLLDFAAAHPERLTLRHQGGIIEQSQVGPDALIVPTEYGGKLTFALRPHLVIQNADDTARMVLGIWCQAREVRAAWPERRAGATSPAASDIGFWKPTWLSLPAAITWVVTRDMALTKSANQRPNSDRGMIIGICAALALEQSKRGQPVGQHVDANKAWPAIRRLIADEKIVAQGKSMLRVGLTSAVTTTFPNARIPSGDVGDLFISNSVSGIEPKDALGPDEEYRFHNGQGRYWYDVRLRAADVFREFPAEPETSTADHVGQVDREKRRGGRREGSGSYERLDKPLIDEMQGLIDQGKAVSPEAAAKMVTAKAYGAGTIDSKIDRLAKRFRANERRNRARFKSD